ncbi:g10818 [Coccomyxa viridis]|uniref:G10818 protein n=1 Tax=Coccomyxa viridis TaxID=1274662 RepID=A0ABP1G6D2_9CHLO
MLSPKVLEDPIKCTRCGSAHYCTHRCMKDDKDVHVQSGECNLLQADSARDELGSLLREACLALRLLQWKPPQPALLSNWAKFLDPSSRDDAGVLLLIARAVAEACKGAVAEKLEGARGLSEKEAAEAVCQVFTNSLEYEPILPVASACAGSAAQQGEPPAVLYQLASRFNHSCRANAAYHFKPGGTIVVRTLVDIDADQEICISYLDPLQPYPIRTAQLREKFCFTCCCERCAAERSPPPPAQNGAHDDDAPSPPAWFLSAMAPPGLPDEAAPEDVGRSMSQIRNMLSKLMEQAQELFVRGGRAAEAWAVLEAGIFKAVAMGAHPFHHRCLELYSCLASACRVCAKTGASGAALRRAALYGLLQSAAAEAMLAVGEYGALPQAARNWAETGALLCEVLAAELEQQRRSTPHGAPANVAAPSHVSTGHPQNGSSMQHAPYYRGVSNERPQAHIDWPDIAPAEQTAQGAGHKSIPEPPAEFALVLCATWHALALDTGHDCVSAQTHAAQQRQRPNMPSSLQSQQGIEHGRDEQNAPSSKRQKVARSPADAKADPGSAGTGTAEADSDTDRHAAAEQQHVGPQGLWLDFRLLGEPAGFMSCQAQPSSRPDLRAALKAELAMSGTDEEQLNRLEHIAYGAAICHAHAAGLLQVVLGRSHTLTQSSAFGAFFAPLPYKVTF